MCTAHWCPWIHYLNHPVCFWWVIEALRYSVYPLLQFPWNQQSSFEHNYLLTLICIHSYPAVCSIMIFLFLCTPVNGYWIFLPFSLHSSYWLLHVVGISGSCTPCQFPNVLTMQTPYMWATFADWYLEMQQKNAEIFIQASKLALQIVMPRGGFLFFNEMDVNWAPYCHPSMSSETPALFSLCFALQWVAADIMQRTPDSGLTWAMLQVH